MEAWVNSPQMVETEISRKMWPLSFLLGVQFFLNKTEISTPGGGNRYCDRLFYHMKSEGDCDDEDQPPFREASA